MYAVTPASRTAEVGEVLQGITAEGSAPLGHGPLIIERAPLRLSESAPMGAVSFALGSAGEAFVGRDQENQSEGT